MLIIEPGVMKGMVSDALSGYPDECCGFVFGSLRPGGERLIKDMQVVHNAMPGDKRRRFQISAQDYLRAEQYALDKDLVLLGVYHSHPNHPAIPSEHDRLAAQPWFSYLILSVYEGQFRQLRSWTLNDNEQFEEETITEYSSHKIN